MTFREFLSESISAIQALKTLTNSKNYTGEYRLQGRELILGMYDSKKALRMARTQKYKDAFFADWEVYSSGAGALSYSDEQAFSDAEDVKAHYTITFKDEINQEAIDFMKKLKPKLKRVHEGVDYTQELVDAYDNKNKVMIQWYNNIMNSENYIPDDVLDDYLDKLSSTELKNLHKKANI